MATKKDTPPQHPGAPADYSTLAHAIAAILADPLTPTVIYNDLAEAVNEVFNRLPNNRRIDESPEYIAAVLTAYGESLEKGGTR
jgi:hypothetical protein